MLKCNNSDKVGYLKWEQKHAEKIRELGGYGGKNFAEGWERLSCGILKWQ